MKRQASTYCMTGDHFTSDIETAVKHPLWTPEEQNAMVARHKERMWKADVKRWFGKSAVKSLREADQ